MILIKSLFYDCKKFFEDIKGGLEATTKGKTIRITPSTVRPDLLTTPSPTGILPANRSIVLCIDLFYVDKAAYLISLSKRILYTTAEALPNREGKTIYKAICKIIGFWDIGDLR